ncbi:MAG: 4-vinyl reductase [Clostridia bacterium]|nr:4-vinyl reductase [Deltaproteobacteria bacterium]
METQKKDTAERHVVQIGQQQYALHNTYEPRKFMVRKSEGTLYNRYDQRVVLVTEDFIVGFQLALEEEVGDAAGEIMYRCGYNWGLEDIKGFAKRFPNEFDGSIDSHLFGMVLETWWWPLQAAGWGAWRFDMSHKSEGLVFVDLYESAVAKSLGNVGRVVCHYYAGMFAAAFGFFAKRELSSIEIQCYGMGEEFCKFLIGTSKRINAAQFWVQEGASAKEIINRL